MQIVVKLYNSLIQFNLVNENYEIFTIFVDRANEKINKQYDFEAIRTQKRKCMKNKTTKREILI